MGLQYGETGFGAEIVVEAWAIAKPLSGFSL